MNQLKSIAAALLITVLLGCQTTPKTFNEGMVTTLGSLRGFTQVNLTALQARKISPDDSEHIQKELDNLKFGADVARRVHSTDPVAGEEKLKAVDIAFEATRTYLCKRVPDEPLCKVTP
jgi:hypothetical protein